MTKNAKKIIMVVAGIAISIFLMVYLYYQIDFGALRSNLKSANYWWLLPNIALIMITMVFRAIRWQYMLNPIKRIKLSRIFSVTMIGFMANNVLPLRLGEFVRAYSLSSKEKVTKSASLATIYVERMVFDLLALLIIFGIVIFISPLDMNHLQEIADKLQVSPLFLKYGLMAILAIALTGLGFAIYLSSRGSRESHLLKRLLRLVPERFRHAVEQTVIKFSTGMDFIRDGKCLFWVTLHTFIIWVLLGVSNYFILLAFDFHLPLAASFVILVVVAILITLPASPGFIGVYHAGVIGSIALYIPEVFANSESEVAAAAGACALVMHATQYLVITVVGFYYMRKEHLSFKEIEKEAEG